MQFGDSLVRLAAEIATGAGARKVSSNARASAVSALHAGTRQMLSANRACRMTVASDLAVRATALRQRLTETDAALGAEVQRSRAAVRQDLAARRQVMVANAKALRMDLSATRRDASAAVMAKREETRAEQAAAAEALAASLGQFVAGVQSDTAELRRAVQDQFLVARAAWGMAAAPAPVGNAAVGKAPVGERRADEGHAGAEPKVGPGACECSGAAG